MEDPFGVWKSLTTQGNIIEDRFSSILGAIIHKFDTDVMKHMSYDMFYSISNQFICPGEDPSQWYVKRLNIPKTGLYSRMWNTREKVRGI